MPRNSALLQDELIIEVVSALEGNKPAGPDAVQSIIGLIEACVIHEEIWVDPMYYWGGSIPEAYMGHPVIKGLLNEGLLRRPPPSDELDVRFSELGSRFEMADFRRDLRFTLSAFNMKGTAEATAYELSALIVREVPQAVRRTWLTAPEDPKAYEEMVQVGFVEPRGPEGPALTKLGFSEPELITIEGWNGQGRALSQYAGLLGLNLYVIPRATPHILGSQANRNEIARKVYQRLSKEAEAKTATDIGQSGFSYHKIPPIASSVLRQSTGSAADLAGAILAARHEFRAVRKYLSDFETRWATTTTVRERKALQEEIDAGLTAVATIGVAGKDRLLYRVWDLVKDPTKIPQAIGDVLVARGRKEAAIGRVQGLRHSGMRRWTPRPTTSLCPICVGCSRESQRIAFGQRLKSSNGAYRRPCRAGNGASGLSHREGHSSATFRSGWRSAKPCDSRC